MQLSESPFIASSPKCTSFFELLTSAPNFCLLDDEVDNFRSSLRGKEGLAGGKYEENVVGGAEHGHTVKRSERGG